MLSITPDKYRFSLLFTAQQSPTIRASNRFLNVATSFIAFLCFSLKAIHLTDTSNAITVYTENAVAKKPFSSL